MKVTERIGGATFESEGDPSVVDESHRRFHIALLDAQERELDDQLSEAKQHARKTAKALLKVRTHLKRLRGEL